MIDSHCHLDSPEFAADLDATVGRAKAAGIRAVVNAGNSHEDNARVLEISKKHQGYIYPTMALSPHHAPSLTDEDLERELRLIESNKAVLVGIGETGLDRHHFKKQEEWDKQERFYRAFLQLGEALDLPIVVHSRNAEEMSIRVAMEYDCRVMLHCFLNHKAIDLALESEFLISIPTLKSKEIDKTIKKTPLERLLCETDSPWLWQGKRNEPANVRAAYERVAKIKSLPFERVVDAVDQSSSALFRLKL